MRCWRWSAMTAVMGHEDYTWPPRLDRPYDSEAMFRVKEHEGHPLIPTTAAIVLVTLLLALMLSAAAVYQVLEEYRLLGTWLAQPDRRREAEIRSLAAGHRHPDHHPIDRPGRPAALHGRDAPAATAATGGPAGVGPGDAARRRHPGQRRPGRDHDRPPQPDHRDQPGRDPDPGRGRRMHRRARSEDLGTGGGPLVALADLVADRQAAVWDEDFARGARRPRCAGSGPTPTS